MEYNWELRELLRALNSPALQKLPSILEATINYSIKTNNPVQLAATIKLRETFQIQLQGSNDE